MHAVIVSNGFPPSKQLLEEELKSADLIIGADGGGNTLLFHGLTPHVVIGDMDSFEKPGSVEFEIIHDADQETNDLEKALSLALYRGVETCTVLGAFGRRMDHSLKNLSVLKRFDPAFGRLIFKDERLIAQMVNSSFSAELPVGSIISLFPLSGKVTGITTKGLKYPLNDEILENGEQDGTSNENVEPEFSIEIESGDLVVFIEN
ncbi:thiamine diphosphokinase [Gracilimonas sediminicola]|uniref:Thiamine diphosphokinase n=1 Tax=Gracilimonas sediminicola TaxID=2952158 RepID=A0A9X2L2M7_9BACT|nr:thiamine diphosphokinase [Gracilimonas sediminicola]MCP9291129.1 thiamine diphosphokinase [Gracilimonas sediminicola]